MCWNKKPKKLHIFLDIFLSISTGSYGIRIILHWRIYSRNRFFIKQTSHLLRLILVCTFSSHRYHSVTIPLNSSYRYFKNKIRIFFVIGGLFLGIFPTFYCMDYKYYIPSCLLLGGIIYLLAIAAFFTHYINLVFLGVTEKEFMSRIQTVNTFSMYDYAKNNLRKEDKRRNMIYFFCKKKIPPSYIPFI